MNNPDALDQRLSSAFAGLDLSPGFDARLMERLSTEAQDDATVRARLAYREQLRYEAARKELLSWHHWKGMISGWLTLEVVGGAALVIGLVAATWPVDQLRQFTPELFTLLGVLAASLPFLPHVREARR